MIRVRLAPTTLVFKILFDLNIDVSIKIYAKNLVSNIWFFFQEFRNSPVVASSTSTVDPGHVNPIANGEFTIFTPLSPPHFNNNLFLANEQVIVSQISLLLNICILIFNGLLIDVLDIGQRA